MTNYQSTKVLDLGSCSFRQWRATHSHCQYLHGYRLTCKLWFNCNELDERNWVADFGDFDQLKDDLRGMFDHTTAVAADDPQAHLFVEMAKAGVMQLRVFTDGVGIERFAEYVAKEADKYIRSRTDNRVWVDKAEVFEHEGNSAVYNVQVPVVEPEKVVEEPQVEAPPVQEQPAPPPQVGRPANVGNNVTQGKGNWFSGTSWG